MAGRAILRQFLTMAERSSLWVLEFLRAIMALLHEYHLISYILSFHKVHKNKHLLAILNIFLVTIIFAHM